MNMPPHDLNSVASHSGGILVVAVAVLFSLYRRIRRNIGAQPVLAKRMGIRMGIFALAAVLTLIWRRGGLEGQLCELGGVVAGSALASLGIRLTRFQRTPEGNFYTPNAWLGTAVSLLFIGRVAYRLIAIYPLMNQAGGAGAIQDPASYFGDQKSLLTFVLFGVVVGYYIAYSAGVLWIYRKQNLPLSIAPPPDREAQAGDPI